MLLVIVVVFGGLLQFISDWITLSNCNGGIQEPATFEWPGADKSDPKYANFSKADNIFPQYTLLVENEYKLFSNGGMSWHVFKAQESVWNMNGAAIGMWFRGCGPFYCTYVYQTMNGEQGTVKVQPTWLSIFVWYEAWWVRRCDSGGDGMKFSEEGHMGANLYNRIMSARKGNDLAMEINGNPVPVGNANEGTIQRGIKMVGFTYRNSKTGGFEERDFAGMVESSQTRSGNDDDSPALRMWQIEGFKENSKGQAMPYWMINGVGIRYADMVWSTLSHRKSTAQLA